MVSILSEQRWSKDRWSGERSSFFQQHAADSPSIRASSELLKVGMRLKLALQCDKSWQASMKTDGIRKMRNRAPFRPFEVHLTTGEILPVEHPENMSLPEDEREMFVVWTKRDWNLVEATQVARISVQRRGLK